MGTTEYLRSIALEYYQKGIQNGFSREEICATVCEVIFSSDQVSFEDLELISKEEREYCDLAYQILTEGKGIQKVPRKNSINRSLQIMYMIHEKNYSNYDELLTKIAQRFGNEYKTVRGHLLGSTLSNLYMGEKIIFKHYNIQHNKWYNSSVDTRMNMLIDIEKRLYQDIVELKKSQGN